MIDPKLLALATAIAFGLAPVLLKMAFRRGGSPDTGMIIGLLIAVPMYFALVPFLGLQLDRLTPAAFVAFILAGLFGTGIGRRWMYQSIDLLGASPATAIKNAAPVITTLLAALLYREAVTPLRWAAVIAIVSGAVLVSWKPGSDARQWLGLGVLYAFAAALVYGVRPLFLKFGLEAANIPLTAACIGALAALAYALAMGDRSELRVSRREGALGLFLVAGALQAIGFLALTFGLSGGDVSVVYPVTASSPLFTLAFTAVLLRGIEELTWGVVLGAIAVVAGVIVL